MVIRENIHHILLKWCWAAHDITNYYIIMISDIGLLVWKLITENDSDIDGLVQDCNNSNALAME